MEEYGLSLSLVIALLVLALVELGLLVWALVSLVRRPVAGVRFHTKLPWVLIIVLVSWIGPLVYFAIGRVDIPAGEGGTGGRTPAGGRAEDAVDLLYGGKTDR